MTNPYTARRRKRPKGHLSAIIAAITVALLAGYMLKVMASSKDDRDTAVTTEAIVPADIDLLYVRLPDGTANSDLDYTGFRIGFNASMHEPNYAAWELDSARLDGAASRKDAKFQSDPDVDGCATLADYRNSGYDRGHMVPAADMKWDEQAMHDCHYLTNIAPQQQQLNTGAWNSLEGLCRKWAARYGRLVVVAGPVLTDKITTFIGPSQVAVPSRYYKVVLAPDLAEPMGIGFIMPNRYVEGGVQASAVTIDQVEAVTGIDFFSGLPDSIENIVESQARFHKWNTR